MNAFGTDINPTARMIAKSKTMDYNLIELKKSVDSLEDLEKFGIINRLQFKEPEFVTWERLEDWFLREVLLKLVMHYHLSGIIMILNRRYSLKLPYLNVLDSFLTRGMEDFKLYRMKEEKRQDFYESLLPKIKQRIQRNLEGLEDFMEVISEESRVEIFDFNSVETNGASQIKIPVDIVVTSLLTEIQVQQLHMHNFRGYLMFGWV